MLTLSADSINELFVQACAAVLEQGREVAPRGLATREVLGAWLCLKQPRCRVLDVPPRVINPAFAAAEAVWILSGSDDEWIYDFNRQLLAFTDDGRLQGAYGPRLRRWHGRLDQLDQIVSCLRRDPDSRQAVVQLFDPARDHLGHRDVPCTLGWRFYLRQGALHLHTTMRSQDLWLGFPYDVFTFTVLQELVAGWLGVQVGEYHHHVDSLHLYQQNWQQAARLAPPIDSPAAPEMATLTVDQNELDALLAHLADPAGGAAPQLAAPSAGSGWQDIATVMDSYRHWRQGERTSALTVASTGRGALTEALRRWYTHLDSSRTDERIM